MMSRLNPPVGPGDHAQGRADAPVTLVEYGDYQCPYCGAAYGVVREVQRQMGSRLRFVFRNFPLTQVHAHALRAAEFAEAAGSIGRFWEAHDMLYERQEALQDGDLMEYSALLGLSRNLLLQAFGGSLDAKIRGDFTSGLRSGVNGTPTLFINGQRYDGPFEVQNLITALESVAAAEGATNGQPGHLTL
ncbi:thioredoxin domain-containing protein [Xanthobacter sp. DSM 24535]|uniref:DsbA family protein n=1 Tax=Roseixanthobacter psychrophilus TaxID=3119917 RepID=UPI00372ABBEB